MLNKFIRCKTLICKNKNYFHHHYHDLKQNNILFISSTNTYINFTPSTYIFTRNKTTKSDNNTKDSRSRLPNQTVQLDFLGTSAMVPSKTRKTSSILLRMGGRNWVFDTGELTQVGLQKMRVKPNKIEKIFITHMHGDHILGLPGVLFYIKLSREFIVKAGRRSTQEYQNIKPIEIYGPKGLRSYLRSIEAFTPNSFTKYIVHELHDDEQSSSSSFSIPVKEFDIDGNDYRNTDNYKPGMKKKFGKMIPGGRNIKPNKENMLFDLFEDEHCKVMAGKVHHSVPTYGFVVQEHPPPRKINGKLGDYIIQKHREELLEAGLNENLDRDFFQVVAQLADDEYLEFEHGKYKYKVSELKGPEIPGRKISILGDCCDLDLDLKAAVRDSDLLVHEMTNPALPEFNDATQRYSWARMSERGHSNASMVAQRIKELKPKKICLTHFGQRYSDYFPKDEVTGKSYVDPKFQDTIRNFLYTKVNDDDLGGEEIISRNDIFVAYDEFSIEVKMDSQPVSDWYTNVVIGMDQKLDVKKEVATEKPSYSRKVEEEKKKERSGSSLFGKLFGY